ncbi:TIGR04104 family putative zinc finger protein [Alteribacter aurantiacus]|uniref:TIGR04104 family putative zinc finger protein n=1 Tax=Alteribacter aurantiacus TaxID=254410 RepID=UPI00068701B6|nr:TIGR04104 family putative zinc finger protein [Alteribacter aurantiacus]
MKVPKCWSCEYSFTWKELFFFLKKIKCPQCGEIQHTTKYSNWKLGVLATPLPFIMHTIAIVSNSWTLAAVVTLVALIVYSGVIPFYMRFTKEKQTII